MHYLRTIAVLALASAAACPASARGRAPRRAPKPKPVAPSVPTPAPDVARSAVIFIADGYSESDFRAARGDGFLAMDRLPVAGLALPPAGLKAYDSVSLGRVLGTAQAPGDAAAPAALFGLARLYGKSIALVSGDSPAGPLLCGLTLAGTWDGTDALRRLMEQRVDVLYGRILPSMDSLPGHYTAATDADALLRQERAPALGSVSAETVPFETLVFRALHLAAKGSKGFALAAVARRADVPAEALDAAIASAARYAERDTRTLVLVLCRRGETELLIHAYGPAAHKFGGVLAATDIPKIVAGVMGLKVFRRDFSPLFLARAAAQPEPPILKPTGTGIHSLPW